MTPWKPPDAGGKCLFPDLLASGCWKLLSEIGYKGAGLKNTLGQLSFKHLPTYLQLFGPFSLFLLSLIDFFLLLQDSSSCCCDHNANTSEPNRNHLSPCQPDSSHLQLFPDNQWEGEFHHILGIPASSVQHKYSQKLKWHWRSYAEGQTFKTLN